MKKLKPLLIIVFIILFLIIYLYYQNTQLQVTNYLISDKNIPSDFNNFKIIQISDFHNTKYKRLRKKDFIEYGDLELNITNSKVTCKNTNETIELVCKVFQLLEYFITNSEQIL